MTQKSSSAHSDTASFTSYHSLALHKVTLVLKCIMPDRQYNTRHRSHRGFSSRPNC